MRWYALMVVLAVGFLIAADDHRKSTRKGSEGELRAPVDPPVAIADNTP